MSSIQIHKVSYSYEGSLEPIFENLQLQLDTSWRLGLIGRNGKGKTTFLKMLMKELPYTGTISSSVSFDYFPLEIKDPQQLTQFIIESYIEHIERWQIVKELRLLKLDEDILYRPYATLSAGEQCKVMLVILFLKENHFLLIDEPTNHLDYEARETVSLYLQRKSGYIVVSHDRKLIDECCDHILSLNKSTIELVRGNYSSWWRNKQDQNKFERNENRKLEREIKQLSNAAKQTAAWSDKVERTKNGTLNSGVKIDKGYVGHQAAKMMKRSKAIEQRQERIIEDKKKLLHDIEQDQPIKMNVLTHHKQQLIALSVDYIEIGQKQVCLNTSLSIMQGERIAVTGKNGVGKSTLLKLIKGERLQYQGYFLVASQLKVSYISQSTAHLKGSLRQYAIDHQLNESLLKTILRQLDFSRILLEQDMSSYSEGQKKKVLLAHSIVDESHLYVWDEPLNYIDVISRDQIEQLIMTYEPTLIFVEHDQYFTDYIATRKVTIEA